MRRKRLYIFFLNQYWAFGLLLTKKKKRICRQSAKPATLTIWNPQKPLKPTPLCCRLVRNTCAETFFAAFTKKKSLTFSPAHD